MPQLTNKVCSAKSMYLNGIRNLRILHLVIDTQITSVTHAQRVNWLIITPCTCAQQGVKQLFFVSSVKIARSEDLGI